ncbi:hypothetical protein B4N89_35930 [Embleya scabrispora]|uniref:Uncharacterized protein n=1 Tax=Embleya scabrispora TaxID=159449 RepID=A0A1T3NLP0_9ACTN|nr:hypothetical protein [Embleya scabrispora]OPC77694.1 hypothetical protein B4N89_35930 [Embleya scabrispora]
MAVERWNLENIARMGQPYSVLDRGTVQGHGGLAMTYHHVVPYNVLRKLWNDSLETPADMQSFMGRLAEHVTLYASMRTQHGGRLHPDDVGAAGALATLIAGGAVVHDKSARRPGGFDDLVTIYQWLPGNLFIGPTERADDPHERFESGARPVLHVDDGDGDARFEHLQHAYASVQNARLAAWQALEATQPYVAPAPFRDGDWVWDQTLDGPRIVADPPAR